MSRLESFAARRPILFSACLAAAASVLRLTQLLVDAAAVGTPPRNLAFFFDGLAYIYISQTFPRVYFATSQAVPIFLKPEVLTAWFPVYPLVIRLFDFFLRDARISALVASNLAGSAAVVLFHRIAKECAPRPALVSCLYCLFPPAWLMAGGAGMVEPVHACLVLAAVLAFRTGRLGLSAALVSVDMIAQKSGFLLLPIFAATEYWEGGFRSLRRLAPFALSPIPAVALQAYLCVGFGDPWVTWRVMRDMNIPPPFQWPFQAFLTHLFSSEQMFRENFWLRKALLASSCAFYCATFAAAWRRRARLDRGLIAWLGVMLLFQSCMGGVKGYIPFARHLTAAAPAALILATTMLDPFLPGDAFFWAAALIVWLPVAFVINSVDVIAHMEYTLRAWPRGYFQLLTRWFGG